VVLFIVLLIILTVVICGKTNKTYVLTGIILCVGIYLYQSITKVENEQTANANNTGLTNLVV
jgi:hypothetical protein